MCRHQNEQTKKRTAEEAVVQCCPQHHLTYLIWHRRMGSQLREGLIYGYAMAYLTRRVPDEARLA